MQPYKATCENLVQAFSSNLTAMAMIVKATEAVMLVISEMNFGPEYKSALAAACIDAASLINVTKYSSKEEIVDAFKFNLYNELAHLFDESPTSYLLGT